MNKYVADDEVILSLAGLRWVAKEDSQFLLSPQKYQLKWNYKGSESYHVYDDKVKRDAMYDQARASLTSVPK